MSISGGTSILLDISDVSIETKYLCVIEVEGQVFKTHATVQIFNISADQVYFKVSYFIDMYMNSSNLEVLGFNNLLSLNLVL